MRKNHMQDRRLHPRINGNLPIRVSADNYDFETSTHNVSCVGAYCRVKRYMPPFTRVMVKLQLPVVDKTYDVSCRGVVVRTDDELNGGFNIAIFFNGIKDEERSKIVQYVNQFLPSKSPAV